MQFQARFFIVVPAIAALLLTGCSKTKSTRYFEAEINAERFYKGNIHTHTSESDGDAPPDEVIAWYRSHGYDFLSITDHEKLVPPSKHQRKAGSMTLIPGVEITSNAKPDPQATKTTPIHVNALCGRSNMPTERGIPRPVGQVLRERVDMAHKDGAIAMVNHPNFGWALGLRELELAKPFELLEIASAHPVVFDEGDSSHISQEALWDQYLSKYGNVYGTAVDDGHDYRAIGEKRFPGLAWVSIWSAEKKPDSICDALRRGNFYSSKGADLHWLRVKGSTLSLEVKNWDSKKDRVEFVGFEGRILSTTTKMPAEYHARGGEVYVRARVIQNKAKAWTQAYFLQDEKLAN